MKTVSKNNYISIQPNINIKIFNNLSEDKKQLYLFLLSNYQYYLELYLLSKTNIKKFDDNIKNSNFKSIDYGKMDYYQTFCGEGLKYYYIRNNINVLSLTNEEQEIFLKIIKDSNKKLTPSIEKFIEDTFQKVIKENCIDSKINYGPMSKRFFVQNGTLVIGMRYDEFYQIGDKILDEKSNLQDLFLLQNNALLEKDIEDKLQISCRVIKYNDFNIKRLNNLNENKKI